LGESESVQQKILELELETQELISEAEIRLFARPSIL